MESQELLIEPPLAQVPFWPGNLKIFLLEGGLLVYAQFGRKSEKSL